MNKAVKRSVIILALAALVLSIIPRMEVWASSGGHVAISVSPTELSSAGTVTVTIALNNTNSSAPQPTPVQPTEPAAEPTQPPVTTPAPGDRSPEKSGYYTNIRIVNSYNAVFNTDGVSIAPGSQKSFSASLAVSEAMLGVNLSFTVQWDDDGTPKSETVTCKSTGRALPLIFPLQGRLIPSTLPKERTLHSTTPSPTPALRRSSISHLSTATYSARPTPQ